VWLQCFSKLKVEWKKLNVELEGSCPKDDRRKFTGRLESGGEAGSGSASAPPER
jgi:hypothetical protein